MSLVQNMSKGNKKNTVHISEIRCNPENEYVSEELCPKTDTQAQIEALALSIEEHGLLHNLVVYEDESGDGKKYTLLSGEKRYHAIELLIEQGKHNGYVDVQINEKPADISDEIDIISSANLQLPRNHKILYKEIKQKEAKYDELKKLGKVPKGLHKRDYVAKCIGISSRNWFISSTSSHIKVTDLGVNLTL